MGIAGLEGAVAVDSVRSGPLYGGKGREAKPESQHGGWINVSSNIIPVGQGGTSPAYVTSTEVRHKSRACIASFYIFFYSLITAARIASL